MPCLPNLLLRPLSRALCLAPFVSRLIATVSLSLLPGHAAPALLPVPWNAAVEGQFVMAMAQDRQGNIWLGTEDNGLTRFDPHALAGKQLTPFTAESTNGGLGDDDIYSLCCDRLGRVWAGTLNHGVSVFNGKSWKTYDQLTGPLGCHVVALATSPVDGDVWGATEAGLFRYSLAHNTWTYYTRANGLPSDQATCLAFDKRGTLYVGTDCDGIAIGSPTDGFQTWRTVPGPAQMPASPGGDGLPSALINCLLVSRTGTVYAGTTTGLARSEDGGKSWRFLRGADWEARVKGLYNGPAPVPTDTHGRLLLEDWVSALAEDNAGQLWVGYRSQDVEVINQDGARLYPLTQVTPFSEYVTALLPRADGSVLEGKYGGGLALLDAVADTTNADIALPPPLTSLPVSLPIAPVPTGIPPLPLPAKPPTLGQLSVMLHRVKAMKAVLPAVGAAFLGDDWQTQGDWVGRYGREYAVLCAMNHVLTCSQDYKVDAQIGPHHTPDDGIRWWVTWMQTDNPKSLYTPVKGVRRQAEWDDHGEAYDAAFDGPDIWVHVRLGEGSIHRISLYFVNKDAQGWYGNRDRDYLIQIKPYRSTLVASDAFPALAQARVSNFWGGVYKQFAVKSPGDYYIKISRNFSLNTILSGVFIDKLAGKETVTDQEPMAYMNGVYYNPPEAEPLLMGLKQSSYTQAVAASTLWAGLDASYDKTKVLSLQAPYRLLSYRALLAAGGPDGLLANWCWSLHFWTPEDREQFNVAMEHAWTAGIKLAHARTPAEVVTASQ